VFAQWDGAAAVTAERSDTPTTLAKPGFATRSASTVAKSESQDLVARIEAIRRCLE
jgi:hypothetical protein